MKSLKPCGKFMWLVRLILLGGLMLSSLTVVAACSTQAISKGKAASKLTPAEQEEQDSEFWRMWEERRGLGE
jgi:hypothetical protein